MVLELGGWVGRGSNKSTIFFYDCNFVFSFPLWSDLILLSKLLPHIPVFVVYMVYLMMPSVAQLCGIEILGDS